MGRPGYTDQRYYNPNAGRFYTPDPLRTKAADPSNPTSWNMYLYAGDDPANLNDPSGLDEDGPPDSSVPTISDYCAALAPFAWMNQGAYQQICGNGAGGGAPSVPPAPLACPTVPQPGGLPAASTVIAQNVALAQQVSAQDWKEAQQAAGGNPFGVGDVDTLLPNGSELVASLEGMASSHGTGRENGGCL
jgi:RHS repeat-associated protein